MDGAVSSASVPPFFVVGAPRTGTTLVRRLLSSHSRIAIPPESLFVAEYLAAERVPFEARRRLLTEEPDLAHWGISLTETELASCKTMADCLAYAHRKYAAARGKDVWGQKTPKLVRHVDLLVRHFPKARFLHVVRDGRAVVASLRRSDAHRLNVLYGARRYAQDAALGVDMEARYPERTMRVTYEALVAAPAEVLGDVCAFLGVTLEPAMVDASPKPLRLNAMEEAAGHHVHVSGPIRASFAEKWREELSEREIALVDHFCGDVLRTLGYDANDAAPPASTWLAELKARHLAVSLGKTMREVREREDVWRVARRRVKLGAMADMALSLFRGM